MRGWHRGSGRQHPRWKGLFGGTPLQASPLGRIFLLQRGLLRGAEGIERVLSSLGGCKRFSFPQRVVERVPSRSCAYLPVNYLRLLLDKSLRITDLGRGRSISRLGGTGTGTSCQQQTLAPAAAWT